MENKSYGATIDGESYVSFIIPVAGTIDQFAVGLRRRVGVIQWDGKSSKAKLLRIAFEVEQSDEFKDNVLNDGKADPCGRLYTGIMGPGSTTTSKKFDDIFVHRPPGGFYKYAVNEKVVQLFDTMQISNGMAWNVKTNKFYLIDSCDFDVKEFDYDPFTGDLCELLPFDQLLENPNKNMSWIRSQQINALWSISSRMVSGHDSRLTVWQLILKEIYMSPHSTDRKYSKSIQRKWRQWI